MNLSASSNVTGACSRKIPYKRAETRRLVEWFLIKLEHDVTTPLTRERVIKPQMRAADGGGAPDSKVLRTARANIRQHLKYLSWLAGSRPWLAGDRLSYADLAAAAAVSLLDYLGEIDWKDSPQAKDWYQRGQVTPLVPPAVGRPHPQHAAGRPLCGS